MKQMLKKETHDMAVQKYCSIIAEYVQGGSWSTGPGYNIRWRF